MSKKGGKSKGNLNYTQKQNVNFIQQQEPQFILDLKKKIGYKEVTINDKFESTHQEGEESQKDEREDEFKPTVVVLDPSRDLTQEQVDIEVKKKAEELSKKNIEQGKMIFNIKKRKVEKSPIDATDNKKAKPINKSLLSFSCDEEDC
uniref:DUF4604 domain-containing protein n=1 Tax=Rhabditophanes sp. KR3021 TaxID=114890 RepID=A0AC35TH71_9BILA